MRVEAILGVLPHRAVKGIDHPSDVYHVSGHETGNIKDLFEQRWESDTHFTCYQIPNEETWPRINKHALGDILQTGVQVVSTVIAVDFDNPNHEVMDENHFERWLVSLSELEGPAADWYCHYTTNSGARLVYVTEEPIPVLQMEDYARGLHQLLRSQGLDPDANASDWNNLYRAPKVLRDGEYSDESDYFLLEYVDRYLNIDNITPMDSDDPTAKLSRSRNTDGPVYHGKAPDSYKVQQLLEVCDAGRYRKTEWYKWAKGRLRGRTCSDAIFNNTLIAERGNRDTKLLQYVGEATAMLQGHMDTAPQHIFALFVNPVAEFETDEDWMEILWSKVTRIWEAEARDRERKESVHQEQEISAQDKFSAIAEGMREWCSHPALKDDANPKVREKYIKRRAIASMGNFYFLLKPDGYYEKMFVSAQQLIPRIEITCMDDIIETWTTSKDGTSIPKTTAMVTNQFSTPVTEIKVVPQLPGGYIDNMDTDHSVLYLPGYRRNNKLVPKFDTEVDAWLTLLGGQYYEDLNRWIALALDFENGPICALSIAAPPGIGKKVFAEGLAECLEVSYLAGAEDLVSQYQSGLMRSPFCVVNEGFPTRRDKDISSTFRQMVGGDTIAVNEKYKPTMRVNNPLRMILTANSDDMVQELTGGKDLSPDDRKAIAERLYHFETNDDAGDYLRSLGGLKHTGRKGNRWIRGDGNTRSDYVVARHFLYLHSQRHRYESGNRLLMHGNVSTSSGLMHKMLTNSGNAPLVMETLIDLIEKATGNTRGLALTGGDEIYVLPKAVLDHFRSTISKNVSGDLTLGTITKILKNLVKSRIEPQVLEGQEDVGEVEWHHIDGTTLLRSAARYGHKCSKLRKILKSNK